MAEDILVKESLTPEMISAGRALVEELERGGFKLASAFWFFEPKQMKWRLCLAAPQIESKGPRFAYEFVSNKLNEHSDLRLEDVSILSSRDSIVNAISNAVNTGGRISGIRFSRNSVNGYFIQDAYIYKS